MLLLDSTLEEQEEKDLLRRLLAMVERAGGRIMDTESWGKRKCAYTVKKQTHAYYELIWFEGDNTIVDELRRQYRITDGIMKYLIVKPTRPVVGSGKTEAQDVPSGQAPTEEPTPEAVPEVAQEVSPTAQEPASDEEGTGEQMDEPVSNGEDENGFAE